MNAATRSSLMLIAALALALAPHIANQPPWLGALLAGLLLLRAGQVFRSWRPAPRWLLIIGAIALAVLAFRAHHSLVGRDGGMALLACLIIAKLYEAKNQRDSTVLLMLAYFCMVAFFLISQSPGMAALALASCILTTTALLLQARPQDKPAMPLKLAGRMVLEAVPIAVLLFLFFPRLPGPLWYMPTERGARSGLSADMMEPGQISQLTLDESVAFRVEFTGAMPPTSSLYWRGPVFETFDGRRWLPSFRRAEPPKITPSGPPVRYTITLEPHQQRWLLALDLPSALPSGAFMSNQLQVLSYQPVSQRQRYSMQSNLAWQTSEDASLRSARSLPAAGNPRARALAASWLNRPPAERVQAALGLLRNGGFTYTLEPPLLTSPDTVDEFLFSSKRGFCEHFAGTFAWLMRAADVPARVVTGYQGGNFNSAGGYLIVRQADAHAWVEVWLEGRGWQRIDPTGQVSPDRLDFGLARSIPQGNDLPMMLRDQASWIKNLRLRMDVVANGWNQWVIGYDIDRQNALLRQLGIEDFLSTRFLLSLLGGIGLILGGLALWLLWPRSQRLRDPASRQYRRFCRKLAKAGLVRGAQEGPQDFARRCIIALPEKQTEIEQITALYLATRYADQTDQLNTLREAIRRFRL